jgi:transposase-like protein/DNA-directed RNA polymerase subunit RPC12/RpoP
MIQTDLYSFSFRQGTLVPWCKNCGAESFYRDGKSEDGKQLYKCKACGFRFVWCSDLPHKRFFSNVISFAVEMYTTCVGISLRTLAKLLEKLGFSVSHQGIRLWVLQDKTSHFVDDKVNNAKTWHCDETYIKIKGIGHWLWIVFCEETRQVLAWHISQTHLLKDALAVLHKAKKRVNGVRPEKIITDGLWQYNYAIFKVIGWSWKEHKERYLIDSGIGKNAVIERVNREVKRRVKWFSTFQALRGAEAFFKLFFSHFNRRTALARNTG